ncbi:carbohydrate ABC transporter permease [Nonomuraea endophytica]|uniref:Multiple sugar transport system permease protein n=1 Tax=Nonomuraea endophytica TaxID=714136 RepID=A0A7W8EKD5_9ACTN|nr:sugar ABC transporter permease [Nonomuraea endophytica]MBB5082496.1 multiple sugar transport system permease protein [Nonomuraea endophytica]
MRFTLRWEARTGLLFVLPCLLLFLAFRFGPSIAGVLLGFFEFGIGDSPAFTGLDNFRRMAGDPVFWDSLQVTLIYTVLYVPVSMAASVGMALLVRRSFRGARFFRSVFFLPVVTSLVLAGTVFTWLFSSEGPITKLTGLSWLASPTLVLPALVIVSVWSRFGYGMLIVLARLQDLPRELEEAALSDGASTWQRFRHIVLPQLRPALFFVAVIETTTSFQVFDLVYVMTGGGPAHGSFTLVMALYEQGFKNFEFGYASAIGVALFVMTLVVALIQRLIIGRSK